MISAFERAIAQMRDPRIIRILIISLIVSALLFAALWGGIGLVLTRTALFEIGWLESAIDVLGGLAVAVLTFLLFPAVASATAGFFLDGVAAAVEDRHYPGQGPPRRQPLAETVVTSLKFLGVLIGLNLLVLLFLPFAPIFPFVFYGANGYLLGREYFELVAARRLDAQAVQALRQQHGRKVLMTGVVLAFLFTLPVVNLAAPIIGTAAMLHVFEQVRRHSR